MHRLVTRFAVAIATIAASGYVAAQPADLIALEEQAVRSAVKNVSSSVVRIESVGGLEKVGNVLIGNGPTTGLVVSSDGYIISSAFNFIQKPTSILVTLGDGNKAAAEIVARDHSRKLVLLKAAFDIKLPVPNAVPREKIEIGQWAIAVGRTFGREFPNLSVGIISAKDRIWRKAIQTDSKVSPANYGGPLVDITGRVYGVLAPLSPQATDDSAGAEWYDSGIGFAIPLEDVFSVLDRLKAGEDLHRGLLGIALKGKNEMSAAPIIATAPAGTPAAKSGIKSGDRVTSINGSPVETQSQLKMALGRSYAGDTVKIELMRDDEKITTTVTLTDKVSPYQLPYLGVLPMRAVGDNKIAGVKIRFVEMNSPAAKTGIQAGDILQKFGDQELATAELWRERLAAVELGEEITIQAQRDGKPMSFTAVLTNHPEAIPQELPSANEELEDAEEKATTGTIEVKIPEEASQCFAFVPDNYDSRIPHGVVIWMTTPGEFDKEAMEKRWKPLCEEFRMIVLAPQSQNPKTWKPTEVDFIRKTLENVMQSYAVDENRVVVHGYKTGASIGYYFALKNRELVRGMAAVDAAIPLRAQVAANDPIERLAWYLSWSKESQLAKRLDKDVERLRKLKFPVTAHEQESVEYLDEQELAELARWIDSLDRL